MGEFLLELIIAFGEDKIDMRGRNFFWLAIARQRNYIFDDHVTSLGREYVESNRI